MEKKSDSKLFYGWVVCGVCTILLFVTMGTASNGLSVFMPYIMEDYGLTGTQTSTLVTLRCTFAFIAMLVISKYYEVVGFRIGTGIAALCCAGAYVIYSCATGYLHFCIGASLAGVSYGLGSMIPMAILMNRWFVKHKSLAIGICSAGSSLAIIVLPPVLTGVILEYSLRTAFLFTAGYAIVFAILIFLLIRDNPADLGLEPLGKEEVFDEYRSRNKTEAVSDAKAGGGRPAGPLTRSDWLLLGSVCVMMGALGNPGFMHLTVLFTDEGFSPMTVAMLVSVCGILLTVSKVVLGETADLMGGYRASALFYAILILGTALCCLAFLDSVPLAVAAAAIFGIGNPICTVGIPIWAGDLVPEEYYGKTLRNLQLIYAAGAMVFANLPGIMADLMGGYVPAYLLYAILLVPAFASLSIAYRRRTSR